MAFGRGAGEGTFWRWFAVGFLLLGCGHAPQAPVLVLPAAKAPQRETSEKLCANIMEENDVPRCVHELTPVEQSHRAWSYRVFYEGAELVRFDTINGLGFPVDDARRVASHRYRYEGGRVKEIERRSQNGVLRGYERFTYEKGPFAVWLDAQGRFLPWGYSRAVAAIRRFDTRGRAELIGYLDAHGRTTPNDAGVIEDAHAFDERGLTKRQAFFGPTGAPAENSNGFHRMDIEHDDWGEWSRIRYFDPAGAPVVSRQGFHEVRRRFDQFHQVIEVSHYDLSGAPVSSSADNASSVRFVLDEHGGEVELDYFDEHGAPTRSNNGFATVKERRDARGGAIEWRYFGPDGAPTAEGKWGAATIAVTRDVRGNQITRQLLDAQGKPTKGRGGFAAEHLAYDARDNQTELEYFDEDGAPLLSSSKFHKKVTTYDGDREMGATFFDLAGKLVMTTMGYAEYRTNWEDGGARGAYQFFDTAGLATSSPPECKEGYEEAQRAAVAEAIARFADCSNEAGTTPVAIKLNVNRDGTPRGFVPLLPAIPDAAKECLRQKLIGLVLPRPPRVCAAVKVALPTKATKGVAILDLGQAAADDD